MQHFFRAVAVFAIVLFFVGDADARRYGNTRSQVATPLSVKASLSWGGVLLNSQARIVKKDTNAQTPVVAIGSISFDADNERFCVTVDRRCYSLVIAADRLARIASFVDNGGVGIYTAYEPSGDVASEEGLAPCLFVSGWCAEEAIGDFQFERAISALDFPEARPLSRAAEMQVLNRVNRNVAAGGRTFDCDYEVNDVPPTSFTATLTSSGSIVFSGRLHQMHRQLVDPQ